MKIRHILPGFGRIPVSPDTEGMSGIVGVAYYLCRELAAHGQETELLGLASSGQPADAAGWPQGVRRVPIRPWTWLKLGGYDFRYVAPAALRLALSGPADIHHIYSNPYLLGAGRASRRLLHYQTPVGKVPAAYRRAVQRADAVICCSEFIRDQFLRHVQYPAERVHVVYNGVDLARFRAGDRAASRARLHIPLADFVVLFAGQVNPDKGLLYLVRACRGLAATQRVHLLVAGSSGLWGGADSPQGLTDYERQVAQEAAGVPATFLGKVAHGDMPAVYQAADVFVCPSVWDEPFGMVNLEAMASGLPVVGSRAGGIPEAIVDGVTGFVVPPAQPAALARVLHLLLDDPQLRERMGVAARARAQQFGWDAIASHITRIYEQT